MRDQVDRQRQVADDQDHAGVAVEAFQPFHAEQDQHDLDAADDHIPQIGREVLFSRRQRALDKATARRVVRYDP